MDYDIPRMQEEIARLTAMVGLVQKPNANLTMDFAQSKKSAEMIKQWSVEKNTELYDRSKNEGKYPWEILEDIDPSPRNLAGEILTPLDALERVMFSLDINLAHTSVDQFFAGPGMILAPAMVLRWIKEGITMSNGASGIWSINRRVNGMRVNPIFLEAAEVADTAAKSPETSTAKKRLAPGMGGLPVTHIGYREKDVKIDTYGRDMTFDYKVVKYASMIELKLIFNFVGMQIGYDDIGNIYELIDVGDGDSGAPPSRLQISGAGGAGVLVFADLVTAIMRLRAGGFSLTHWIGETDSMIDFMNLSQFSGANHRDETLRQLLMGRGPLQTQLGTLLIAPNAPADADRLLFFDSMFAVAKGEESPITIETDKIIQMQFEEIAIAGSWAFWKFAHDASGRINYSA